MTITKEKLQKIFWDVGVTGLNKVFCQKDGSSPGTVHELIALQYTCDYDYGHR